jgi:hypothetical protein
MEPYEGQLIAKKPAPPGSNESSEGILEIYDIKRKHVFYRRTADGEEGLISLRDLRLYEETAPVIDKKENKINAVLAAIKRRIKDGFRFLRRAERS